MRFESKHSYFKKLNQNFTNVPRMLGHETSNVGVLQLQTPSPMITRKLVIQFLKVLAIVLVFASLLTNGYECIAVCLDVKVCYCFIVIVGNTV